MDNPSARRPPIFGPSRQNRFSVRCKHCQQQQEPQLLHWHESQCQKKEDSIMKIVNFGQKLVRGISQGVQRNVQKIGQTISNEFNDFQRIVQQTRQQQQRQPVIESYQEQFDRLSLADQRPNLIEFKFQNKQNLSPSARNCCICQEEYTHNENIVLLQCMHRYHKTCIDDWIKKKPLLMKLLLVFLFLSLSYAQADTDIPTNDDALKEIKQLEKEEQIEIQQPEGPLNEVETQKKEQESEQQHVISSEELEGIVDDVLAEEEADFLDLLEALRPLFGLRYGDVKRNEDGSTVTSEEKQEIIVDVTDYQDQVTDTYNQVQADPLMLQWDELMDGFDPEDLLTFDLAPGATEVLSEIIQSKTVIRGAFFIPQFSLDQKIDFYIKNSNNTVIFSKERVQEGIFKVEVPEKGEYRFIFSNKRTKETLTVTFAIDVHDSYQEHIRIQDLDPIALRIERLQQAMKDNYFFDKMTSQQFESGLIQVQNANNKLLIFSFIEIIGIVALTGWQVYYLKKILSNQRMI